MNYKDINSWSNEYQLSPRVILFSAHDTIRNTKRSIYIYIWECTWPWKYLAVYCNVLSAPGQKATRYRTNKGKLLIYILKAVSCHMLHTYLCKMVQFFSSHWTCSHKLETSSQVLQSAGVLLKKSATRTFLYNVNRFNLIFYYDFYINEQFFIIIIIIMSTVHNFISHHKNNISMRYTTAIHTEYESISVSLVYSSFKYIFLYIFKILYAYFFLDERPRSSSCDFSSSSCTSGT